LDWTDTSVGSLGKYKNEEDVSGIVVTNCTLFNTTNGVRIKSYAASDPSQALNITFKDITMDSVKNPIIIDQKYGSRNGAVIHRQKSYHIMYTHATSEYLINPILYVI
jgi:galacturan 1,4-alpha-galacturonidase